jgi:hypothetical protein
MGKVKDLRNNIPSQGPSVSKPFFLRINLRSVYPVKPAKSNEEDVL